MYKIGQMKLVGLVATIVAGCSSVADAHNVSSALGAGRRAKDVYRVQCFDNGAGPPSHVVFKVQDFGPLNRARLKVTLSKNGKKAVARDKTPGNGQYGPLSQLVAGGGDYTLRVAKKPKRGEKTYDVEIHCWSAATDQHTGTSNKTLIDQ